MRPRRARCWAGASPACIASAACSRSARGCGSRSSGSGSRRGIRCIEAACCPPRWKSRTCGRRMRCSSASSGCSTRSGDVRQLRIHGDCHLGNLLWNEQGPVFVDLDDCMMAPAIQDLWMLLSGSGRRAAAAVAATCSKATSSSREFDFRELRLIEPLRALRMLHHAAWLATRWSDPAFPRAFTVVRRRALLGGARQRSAGAGRRGRRPAALVSALGTKRGGCETRTCAPSRGPCIVRPAPAAGIRRTTPRLRETTGILGSHANVETRDGRANAGLAAAVVLWLASAPWPDAAAAPPSPIRLRQRPQSRRAKPGQPSRRHGRRRQQPARTPGAVDMRFASAGRPAVGQPLDIQLVLTPTVELDRLVARFQAPRAWSS